MTAAPGREAGAAWRGLLLVVALAAGGAAWWWHGQSQGPPSIDPDRVVKVMRRDLMKAVIATGHVEPLARVEVMSRASGILKELRVEEGDRVVVGQVLAELDREQLEAQNAENEASLKAAEARLLAARARLDEARVRLVDPELEFAKRQFQRLEQLFEDGSISQNELDDAELRMRDVEYRMRQTEASIPVLEAGVAQAEADVLAAQASLDRTRTALREATILSPIDGVVLQRLKEVGDGVSSILTAGGNATPILLLGDLSAMFVEAKVDEVDVGRIHDEMRAVVTVDAYRDLEFEGEVERIAPAGTVDNNGIVTFLVRIAVGDPQGLLRVDMTANTRLVIEARPDTLALPHRALLRGQRGDWTVRRVSGGEPQQVDVVTVRIGVSDGLVTEVLEGLSDGDLVLLPDDPRVSGGGPPTRRT